MKRVNVLMSTYNGQDYIKEQIESILNQTYHNIKLYVRDDGSTDCTIDILQCYEQQNKIVFIKGNNVGYGASFMQLLLEAEDSDYWAFSDQDDVWDREKIERAVMQLEKMDQDMPAMYCHNYYITDQKLQITGKSNFIQEDYPFYKAITECVHLGFATVINRKLREMMLLAKGRVLISHDWWAELIATEFGTIYVDSYMGAWHRRLENSVSGGDLTSRFKWLWNSLKNETEIHNLTENFWVVFQNKMKNKDKIILSWFVSEKYNLDKALRKVFYYRRWRSGLASEVVVRFLMLIGRI